MIQQKFIVLTIITEAEAVVLENNTFMETTTFTWIGETLFYIILFFILVIIANAFLKLKYRKISINDELSEKDNVAFSIVVVGYFSSILIVFLGVIHGEFHGYIEDTILIISYGILGILFLLLSSFINEKIVFQNKLKLHKEIFKDENKGTGYVEAANFISSSLIVYGAISGQTQNFLPFEGSTGTYVSGFLSLVAFWLAGQLLITLLLKIYIKISKYDIINQLEKDNVAVGIVFSGMLIGFSILYATTINGTITNWKIGLENILYTLVLGVILLPLARLFIEKMIVPKADLVYEIVTQKVPNQGIAIIEAFAYIGSAILISFCI